jgi:transcriptional regulator with GAF, ATPase, and Fis domain
VTGRPERARSWWRAACRLSPRKDKRFASQLLGGRRDAVRERLFSHVRGAFTGATDWLGLFGLADNGTLFLDGSGCP